MGFKKINPFLLLLFLVLLFLTQGVSAQNVDSIRNVIEKIISKKEVRAVGKNNAAYNADTIKIGQSLRLALQYQKSNYDSLLFYSTKALNASLKLGDLDKISRSVQMLGRYFMLRVDYRNAGDCFIQSLKIEEKLNHKGRIADLSDEIGGIYYFKEIFPKAQEYYLKALEIYENLHDTLGLASVYSHLGSINSSREFCETRNKAEKLKDFTTAIYYHQKSVQLCTQIGYKPLMNKGYVSLASVYNKLDHPEKALPYLKMALQYFRSTKSMNSLASTLHTTGTTYRKLKQYDESIKCYQESLKIGFDYNFTDGIQFLYESMAQAYEDAKDYKNALQYYIKYMTVKDSVSNAEKTRELFELETKYQSEKNEKEIVKLRAEKREKNIMLLALSGLILILSFLGYFIVKQIRNKRIIAEQTLEIKERQILELEKERQLIATKSVLQGEEAERTRMARDLHDGLGGMLSSVKINLSSMKGNSIITNENAEAFNHAIGLLDHSIKELRRVAHNMMPETLVHYGLKTAFEDFISRIGTDNTPEIDFQFFGEAGRYSSELEITVYRIGQELVNNALKHSGAKTINLQLISETSRLCIQVIDNGKGFDTSQPSGGGKGLESIRDRVTAMNGTFEIWSKPDEGTETTVEFLVP
jgi:two-component system, NarL family, sensor kinase